MIIFASLIWVLRLMYVNDRHSTLYYSFTPAFSQVPFYDKYLEMNIYVSNLGFDVKNKDPHGIFYKAKITLGKLTMVIVLWKF